MARCMEQPTRDHLFSNLLRHADGPHARALVPKALFLRDTARGGYAASLSHPGGVRGPPGLGESRGGVLVV